MGDLLTMKVLFAGGGTAGHINPALAVAQRLKERLDDVQIEFAGSQGRIEERLVPKAGYKLVTVKMHGLRRKLNIQNIFGNIKTVSEIFASTGKMKRYLKEYKPDVVIGMGGYAAYPALAAAKQIGIPIVLMEVNALPGVCTKIMASSAKKILVSFDETKRRLGNRENVVKTGIPVREGIIYADRKKAKRKLGIVDKPLVLSFWGSLGASGMNKKMEEFIKLAKGKSLFYHIHASGENGYRTMSENLKSCGIKINGEENLEVRQYINNMEELITAADVIICRAGASTIAEICACGRASVIVPSPNVAENHQEINARALEREGAALVMLEGECTGEDIYKNVSGLLKDNERRLRMEQNSQRMAVLDAGDRICDMIEKVCLGE